MDKMTLRLFYHLDSLREDAGISVSDFCEGVIDRRQYSRYLNGSQKLSYKNMIKLCDRLGFSDIEFYYSYYQSDMSEYSQLNRLYYDLVSKDLVSAKEKIIKLRDIEFTGQRSIRYFQFELIYYDYLAKKITEASTVEQLKNLIDYTRCIKKSYFDFIDIVALRLIMIIETKTGKKEVLEFLYSLIKKDSFFYVTSETRNVLPSLYVSIAKEYGMLGEFKEVLDICEKGIEYSVRIYNMHLLEDLYYYKSLALYKLGMESDAFDYARKALSVLDARDSKRDFIDLKELIDKDFSIDSYELFKYIDGFYRKWD